MKWFKHYSDVQHSESVAELEEKFGFEGLGRYWRLIEFLCEKFDGEDYSFRVHSRIILRLLRFHSRNKLSSFLERVGNVRGMNLIETDNVIEFKAPILLELQSRDFKKARKGREQTAPKIKSKIKSKNKNNIKEKSVFDFSFFKDSYKQATGVGILGQDAKKRFNQQIKNETEFNELLSSVQHYGDFLNHPDNEWRKPKQSIAAYLGTTSSGFFWRDFVEKPDIVSKSESSDEAYYDSVMEKLKESNPSKEFSV